MPCGSSQPLIPLDAAVSVTWAELGVMRLLPAPDGSSTMSRSHPCIHNGPILAWLHVQGRLPCSRIFHPLVIHINPEYPRTRLKSLSFGSMSHILHPQSTRLHDLIAFQQRGSQYTGCPLSSPSWERVIQMTEARESQDPSGMERPRWIKLTHRLVQPGCNMHSTLQTSPPWKE